MNTPAVHRRQTTPPGRAAEVATRADAGAAGAVTTPPQRAAEIAAVYLRPSTTRLRRAVRVRPGAGFTLIELLLAVSIFSIIAIAGVYVLRQAVVGAEQQIAVVNSSSELQQALWLMSQDMYNLIDREAQVGDKTEMPIHTKQEGEDNPLGDRYQTLFNLTRLSWIDSRYKYTSQLLRVAYALRRDDETGLKQLVRLHWPYVDRAATQKPFERVLINKVREASVSFYSEGKKDLKKWPLRRPDNNEVLDEDAPARFPDGLKFALTIDGYGEFEKIISVNLDTVVIKTEEEEDEDGPEEGSDEEREEYEKRRERENERRRWEASDANP